MIIPDANLLVYAHNAADPDHKKAKEWWRRLVTGTEEVGIPMAVVMAFVRLTTSSRVLTHPLDVSRSTAIAASWFERPPVRLLHPSADHLRVFFNLANQVGVGGNLTTDIHLAALALEYRAVIHSADADFGRFSGIRWVNPLK